MYQWTSSPESPRIYILHTLLRKQKIFTLPVKFPNLYDYSVSVLNSLDIVLSRLTILLVFVFTRIGFSLDNPIPLHSLYLIKLELLIKKLRSPESSQKVRSASKKSGRWSWSQQIHIMAEITGTRL